MRRRKQIMALAAGSLVLCLACLIMVVIWGPEAEPPVRVDVLATAVTPIVDVRVMTRPRLTNTAAAPAQTGAPSPPAGRVVLSPTTDPANAPAQPPPPGTRSPSVTQASMAIQAPTITSAPVVPTFAPSLTALSTPPAAPDGQAATVVRVIDGDTIEVAMEGVTYRVRYIGMDTPEYDEPFFLEASEANRQLVEGKTVVLIKDVSEVDRYGRLLRYVYLQDGNFVNAELVRLGYAQAATYPPDVAQAALFVELEREARNAGIGLWTAPPEAAVASSTPLPTALLPATVPPAPPTTPLPEPTAPPPAVPGVVIISAIFFDGQLGSNEPDEYAVISNQGNKAVNMAGWRLNADDRGQDFYFPAFDLLPGQSCRVYTNQVQADSCGGTGFGYGKALWANKGECGHLYDAGGVEVSTYCY